MRPRTVTRLEELARADPAIAPLARLQAEARSATADLHWEEGVPALERRQLADGLPLLHGQTLHADPDRVRRLLDRLAAIAGSSGHQDAQAMRGTLGAGALDPLAMLEASIAQDAERLERLAAETGADVDLLATLGQLAAFPLLQACGRIAAPLLEGLVWEPGYCPVCAAWATLAELRGLERQRWLRCGRCGAGWSFSHQRCPFCASSNHRAQGYLAPEADRESRRALTCDDCQGYLKALTTVMPTPPDEIGVQDLTTLELDLAAIDRDYGRPQAPGFPLVVSVEPAPRRTGWLAWRR